MDLDNVVQKWSETTSSDVSTLKDQAQTLLDSLDPSAHAAFLGFLKSVESPKEIKQLESTFESLETYVSSLSREDQQHYLQALKYNSTHLPQDLKNHSKESIEQWIDTGKEIADDFRDKYYKFSGSTIGVEHNETFDKWVDLTNTLAQKMHASAPDYFRSSGEIIDFISKNDETLIFDKLTFLAQSDSYNAAKVFSQLPEFYNDTEEGKKNFTTFTDQMANKPSYDYFQNAKQIMGSLSPYDFESWTTTAEKLDLQPDALSKFYKTITPQALSVSGDHRSRFLDVMSRIAYKDSLHMDLLSEFAIDLTRSTDKDTLYRLIDVATSVIGSDEQEIKPFYEISAARLQAIKNKDRVFDKAKEAIKEDKTTLAAALIEEGGLVSRMPENMYSKFIGMAMNLHDDSQTEGSGNGWSNYKIRLSQSAYGAFIRTIPHLSKVDNSTIDMWHNLFENYEKAEIDNFLTSSEQFFKDADEKIIPELVEYTNSVAQYSPIISGNDFKFVARLSQASPFLRSTVLDLGLRLTELYVDEESNIPDRNEFYQERRQFMEKATDSVMAVTKDQIEPVINNLYKLDAANTLLAQAYIENCGSFVRYFNTKALDHWVTQGLDIYNKEGLTKANAHFKQGLSESYKQELEKMFPSYNLADISGMAGTWITGILGESHAIRETTSSKDIAYTDNESIFLPSRIDKYKNNEKNEKLYMGLLDHEMGHILYKSFAVNIKQALEDYEKKHLAKHIFNMLEDGRIEYNLRKDFGSVISSELDLMNKTYIMTDPTKKDPNDGELFMGALLQHIKMGHNKTKYSEEYTDAMEQCVSIYKEECEKDDVYGTWQATEKVYEIVTELFPELDVPPEKSPGGDVGDHGNNGEPSGPPQKKEKTVADPNNSESNDMAGGSSGEESEEDSTSSSGGGKSDEQGSDENAGMPDTSEGGGGDGQYDPNASGEGGPENKDEQIGQFKYNEWDYTRGQHLIDFTTVKEYIVEEGSTDFYHKTIQEKSALRQEILNAMEDLKPAKITKVKRLPEGSEINMDSYIDAWGEKKSGSQQIDENIFEDQNKQGRDVAICILVDQSGSIGDYKLKTEKQSLVIMSDVLYDLEDKFAIYGFSSEGKDNVRVNKIKGFEETYSDITVGRIGAIKTYKNTRMGPAVRHAMAQLEKVEAKTKVLLYVTDGAPNDYDDSPNRKDKDDHYIYADIRHTIEEGMEKGINSYCVAVDPHPENTYLDEMFGSPENYSKISKIEDLPRELAEFYHRITE